MSRGRRREEERRRRRRWCTPGGRREGRGGGRVRGGGWGGGSRSDGVPAQGVGGPVGFGGEGQRLQLLGVGRRVSTGRVREFGVRRGRGGGGGQRRGGCRRGVQRGGGAGLGQVCVRQVGDGVRLRRGRAGVRVRGLRMRRLLGSGRDTRSLELRGEIFCCCRI